jgi:hypothetical protein
MKSSWAYNALCFVARRGIPSQLSEPRALSYINEHSGIPATLAECVLDILVNLELVHREKDMFTVDPGMLPLFTEPMKTIYWSHILSNYYESQDLVETARKLTITLGWDFTDPEIFQASGMTSAMIAVLL